MKVFITGATGYIGSGVARAIAGAGHDVLALAHHDTAAQAFTDAGYTPVPGNLEDRERLSAAARRADAVIHAANSGGDNAAAVDEAATRSMVEALEGSNKAFVYTSGLWVLGATGSSVADEDAAPNPAALVKWRGPLEKWLKKAADRGIRTVVIRPGIVYGRGGGIPGMMARGELPVIGDGHQRWAVVHVDDLAALYLAAMERAPAGAVLHGVSESVTAGAVGKMLKAAFVPRKQAAESMGPFAQALALDQRASSQKTRDLLNWVPRAPPLLEAPDLAQASK